MVAKRAAPTPEDYITLFPGERLDYVVDLGEASAFDATGTYVVRHAADNPELYLARGAKPWTGTLASNALTINTLGTPTKTDAAPGFPFHLRRLYRLFSWAAGEPEHRDCRRAHVCDRRVRILRRQPGRHPLRPLVRRLQ